jgi:hypothetical protein
MTVFRLNLPLQFDSGPKEMKRCSGISTKSQV